MMASVYALTLLRRKSICFVAQWIKTGHSQHSNFLYCCNKMYHCNRKLISYGDSDFKPIHLNNRRYVSEVVRHCWHCGEKNNYELFCRKCTVLQQPDLKRNYFDILGVEKKYSVDLSELSTKYRKLQNVLHPDRFSNKKLEELKISEDYSSLVNKAYFTLLQPLSRGLYMLQLQGVFINKGTTVTSPEFLMEIMERNQEVEEANAEQLRELTFQNQASLNKLTSEVSEAFQAGNINRAEELLVKMKYYASIAATIKELKQRRGIED